MIITLRMIHYRFKAWLSRCGVMMFYLLSILTLMNWKISIYFVNTLKFTDLKFSKTLVFKILLLRILKAFVYFLVLLKFLFFKLWSALYALPYILLCGYVFIQNTSLILISKNHLLTNRFRIKKIKTFLLREFFQ